MKLPADLMTFGIGVRAGHAAWCAACRTPEGPDAAEKRAEVIRRRKALLGTPLAAASSADLYHLASRAEEPQGWQPIATLPQRYMTVLLCLQNQTLAIGFYTDRGVCHADGWDRPVPTHWMPLPRPPAPEEDKQ